MRSFHVPPAIGPLTLTRSNTPAADGLDARTTPPGSTSDRSMSLWLAGASGHQIAALRTSFVAGIPIGMSIVCALATDDEPRQKLPPTGSLTRPAPLVLVNG